MVHSNHMLISHNEDIGDFHIRYLEMTPKGQSRSKVKVHFYYLGNGEHFCLMAPWAYRSHRQDDTTHFHFRELEVTSALKGQPRSKVIAESEPLGSSSY